MVPKEAVSPSGLYTAIAYDVGYVATEILVEEGLWAWANPGISAMFVLGGYFLLLLTLDYSINFNVGAGRQGLWAQLGFGRMNWFLELLMLFPLFMGFAVAMGFPVVCINEVIVQWGDPKGIDSLGPTGAPKLFLVLLMFFSVFLTYNTGNHFKGRRQFKHSALYFGRLLPVISVVLGAAVSHLGGSWMERSADISAGAQAFGVGLYLYVPMRYLLARVGGISWVSVAVAAVSVTIVQLLY